MEEYCGLWLWIARNPSVPRVLLCFVSSFFAAKEHLGTQGEEGRESKKVDICRGKDGTEHARRKCDSRP